MSSGGVGPPYSIWASDGTLEAIRELYRRARAIGVLLRFHRAMEEIHEALQTLPGEWGDPLAKLSGLRMTHYHRVYDEMRVVFGVHWDRAVVWLVSVTPVLTHPLRASDG